MVLIILSPEDFQELERGNVRKGMNVPFKTPLSVWREGRVLIVKYENDAGFYETAFITKSNLEYHVFQEMDGVFNVYSNGVPIKHGVYITSFDNLKEALTTAKEASSAGLRKEEVHAVKLNHVKTEYIAESTLK